MAADGSIIIDVNLNDNDARRGIRDLNGELGNTRGSEAGINRVSSAIGNIAKVAAVSVAAVAGLAVAGVSLARPFVEAAAAAEAANAQFSAVFGDLETQARQRLNGIAESTNIIPDRLQESFTRIAAFARTTGVDTAAALDLTTRATIAAADSAAFYDRSIEETTESLQSFLKGKDAPL